MEHLIKLIERSATVVLLLRTPAGKAAILIVMLLAQIPIVVIKSHQSFSTLTSNALVAWVISIAAALAYDVVVFSLAVNGRTALSWLFAFFAALMAISTYPNLAEILHTSPKNAIIHAPGLSLRTFPAFVIAYYSHLLAQDYDSMPETAEVEDKITTHTGRAIAEKVNFFTQNSVNMFKAAISNRK